MCRVGRKYTVRVHGSGRVITQNRKFLKAVNLAQQPDHLQLPFSSYHAPVKTSSNQVNCSNDQQRPDMSSSESYRSVVDEQPSSRVTSSLYDCYLVYTFFTIRY